MTGASTPPVSPPQPRRATRQIRTAAPTSGGGVRFFGTNQGGTIYTSTADVVVTQNGAPAGADPLQ